MGPRSRAVADRAEDCGDHHRSDLVLWQAPGAELGACRVDEPKHHRDVPGCGNVGSELGAGAEPISHEEIKREFDIT